MPIFIGFQVKNSVGKIACQRRDVDVLSALAVARQEMAVELERNPYSDWSIEKVYCTSSNSKLYLIH